MLLLLLCAMNVASLGQVAGNCTTKITLNDDASPLNATLENNEFIFNFQKTDVLIITFSEFKSAIPETSAEITSSMNDDAVLIMTFENKDITEDNSYSLIISFSKLQDQLPSVTDNVYTLIIKDDSEQKDLIKFKLL